MKDPATIEFAGAARKKLQSDPAAAVKATFPLRRVRAAEVMG
jgi:hypothetical protein